MGGRRPGWVRSGLYKVVRALQTEVGKGIEVGTIDGAAASIWARVSVYVNAASESPRNVEMLSGRNASANATTTAISTRTAGSSRRARRSQKCRSDTLPVSRRSASYAEELRQ